MSTPDETLDRRRGVHRSPRSGVHRSRKSTESEPSAAELEPEVPALPEVPEAFDTTATRFEPDDSADWYDDDAGPLVRPYTVTGGRVRPSTRVLDLIDFVIAVPGAEADLPNLQPEHVAILMAAREYISVAELAAGLDLALGVIRVLLDDLIRQGLVALRDPHRSSTVDDHLLKAVIDGLRSL